MSVSRSGSDFGKDEVGCREREEARQRPQQFGSKTQPDAEERPRVRKRRFLTSPGMEA